MNSRASIALSYRSLSGPGCFIRASERRDVRGHDPGRRKGMDRESSTTRSRSSRYFRQPHCQVGSSVEIRKLAGPATKVIELGGKRVLPGFNDAHVHFVDGGAGLASVQLRDANSQEEFRDRISAFARTQPKQAWILNGWWDHERWTPAQLPTHRLIDDSDARESGFCGAPGRTHGARQCAGDEIGGNHQGDPDIAGGVIVRDAQGNPTGIFKDAAMALIRHAIPPLKRAATENGGGSG